MFCIEFGYLMSLTLAAFSFLFLLLFFFLVGIFSLTLFRLVLLVLRALITFILLCRPLFSCIAWHFRCCKFLSFFSFFFYFFCVWFCNLVSTLWLLISSLSPIWLSFAQFIILFWVNNFSWILSREYTTINVPLGNKEFFSSQLEFTL